ncbi:MAG: phosphoribosylformimino-5-aminoimidazole carboxamide ribotide isomerase [Lachnospiraceae bacterium]|nr:phosphoribosylformimino-5-aminoimidazole carboxamide ribotide isomerase [Lachnospiraceae bacterium]
MEFRPCIDIHNGQVKQIVGGSLMDEGNLAKENFVSHYDSVFYARMYQKHKIRGGHVILLNAADSEYYEETKQQALAALRAYPGGLQVGGGIHVGNAEEFLEAGASHVIVTSYVFQNGVIRYDRLRELVERVGKQRLVLDLSCRRRQDAYYIVTDRWQKFTDVILTPDTLHELADYCDEFLIHAVDVEGKGQGIEPELVRILATCKERPVTYAGGVHDFADLKLIKQLGEDHVNVTIGSALDLFGGQMEFEKVLACCNEKK